MHIYIYIYYLYLGTRLEAELLLHKFTMCATMCATMHTHTHTHIHITHRYNSISVKLGPKCQLVHVINLSLHLSNHKSSEFPSHWIDVNKYKEYEGDFIWSLQAGTDSWVSTCGTVYHRLWNHLSVLSFFPFISISSSPMLC